MGGNIAVKLLQVVIGFLLAYVISGYIVTAMVTGTATGDVLITTLWQLILAAGGMMLLVNTVFKEAQ